MPLDTRLAFVSPCLITASMRSKDTLVRHPARSIVMGHRMLKAERLGAFTSQGSLLIYG
jgi:hypothetical protein